MLRKAFLATAVATAMLVSLPFTSAKRAEAAAPAVAWVIAGVIVAAIAIHAIRNAEAEAAMTQVKKVRRHRQ